ncbi:unnamed protein product [Prorocentrum cordatum]|uniref:CNNM transmembrane domain-containing protein n=1 Tax=Prorocentrum cordatum TaxID=2364126 RepID=A0ABN9UR86_9DINO|nr:unnamed protein product [Polarella glacialis]
MAPSAQGRASPVAELSARHRRCQVGAAPAEPVPSPKVPPEAGGGGGRGRGGGALGSASERLAPGTNGFCLCFALALLCVSMAALAAGLTMGLVSLDRSDLETLQGEDEKDVPGILEKQRLKDDKVAAQKVLPLIANHHRLLVTLLLMNSVANEALPLFLDRLVPSWVAVVLSVSLVLVFGEIVPSAVFTGSNQLEYASRFTGLVSCFQVVLLPIVWPIAQMLDRVLGTDHKQETRFSRLRAMIKIAAQAGKVEIVQAKGQDIGIITSASEHNFTDESVVVYRGGGVPGKLQVGQRCFVKPCCDVHGRNQGCTFNIYPSEDRKQNTELTFSSKQPLTDCVLEVQERDEAKIMRGVAEMTHTEIADSMKPMDEVDMLELETRLDREKLIEIDRRGHSRLPVYDKNKHNIRGFILVKNLIVYDPETNLEVKVLSPLMKKPVLVKPGMKLLDLLNQFQEHRTHFAIVTNMPERVQEAWETGKPIPANVHMAGIITLEDVIERLLLEEIDDEADNYCDVPSRSLIGHSRSFWENPAAYSKREVGTEGRAVSAPAGLPGLRHPLLGDEGAGAPGEAAGSQESGCWIA